MNFNSYQQDLSDAYYFREGAFTILDTGSSHIFLPGSVARNIIYEIMAQAGNPDYAILAGMVFVECSAQLKPMQLMFDDKWITIDPKHLLFDI